MNASNNPCQCRNTDYCVYEVLKSFMALGGISVYMYMYVCVLCSVFVCLLGFCCCCHIHIYSSKNVVM